MKKIMLLVVGICACFAVNAQVAKLLALAKPVTKGINVDIPADHTLKVNTSWSVVKDAGLKKWILAQEKVENDLENVTIRVAGKTTMTDGTNRVIVVYSISGQVASEGKKDYLFAMVIAANKKTLLANNDITDGGIIISSTIEGNPDLMNTAISIHKNGYFTLKQTYKKGEQSEVAQAVMTFDNLSHTPIQAVE